MRIEILRGGGYGRSIYHNLSPEIELYRILLISRDYFLGVLFCRLAGYCLGSRLWLEASGRSGLQKVEHLSAIIDF